MKKSTVALCALFLGACPGRESAIKKSNDVPTLASMTPTSANVGDGKLTLSVHGHGFVDGSSVLWNGAVLPTKMLSGIDITATISAANLATGGTVSVSVLNSPPGGGTSNALSFTVQNLAPTASALSPSTAIAGSGGFTLAVTGEHFVKSSVVQWNGLPRATTFKSATQLTADVTAADIAGTVGGSVTVYTPAPGGGTSAALVFAVDDPVPVLVGVNPARATAGDGALTVILVGSSFVAGSVAQWNGENLSTSPAGSGQLSAAVPAEKLAHPGSAQITVSNAAPGGGSSTPQTFTIENGVPVASSVNPLTVIAGGPGFTLTLSGDKFLATSVVKWGALPLSTTLVNETQLTATVDAAQIATAGPVSITVTNPAPGGGVSSPLTLTVVNPLPQPQSLVPISGVAGSGAFFMTVSGTGFAPGATVEWNGSDRLTVVSNPTQLVASITSADVAAAGVVVIQVRNPVPGGGLSSGIFFLIGNPVPATTSIAPTAAIAGSTDFTLIVTGSKFVTGAVVDFNGQTLDTKFVDPQTLTAKILASAVATPGPILVAVNNPAPAGGSSNVQTFTVQNPIPVTTSISPSTALVGAQLFTLTVNGSNFVSGSTALWGGAALTTTLVNPTLLTAVVPASDLTASGAINITVQNPNTVASNAQVFSLSNPAPVLNSLSPTAGLIAAPFVLTLYGSSFVSGSVVNWNGSPRPTTVGSPVQLTVTITPSDVATPGAVSVTVTNPVPGGGTSGAQTYSVNYPVPTASALVPNPVTISANAFALTVTGTNFFETSIVQLEGTNLTTSLIDATHLAATVPPSTAALLNTQYSSASHPNVTVVNPTPGGGVSNKQMLTVLFPQLTGFSPMSAVAGGGNFTMTLNGANFVNGSALSWNGSPRTATFVSSSQLTVSMSAADVSQAGTFTVQASNGYGPSTGPLPIQSPLVTVKAYDAPPRFVVSHKVAALFGGGATTRAYPISTLCGLTESGGVKCWGSNQYGSLGNGSITDSTTPVDVTGLTVGISAVAINAYYGCALTNAGGVKCWGNNDVGNLGDNSVITRLTPVDVVGLASGVSSIAIGGEASCAIMSATGGLKCWGELGGPRYSKPVDVAGLTSGVRSFCAGVGGHLCAITSAGGVQCWGSDDHGQLGNGTTTGVSSPTDVIGLTSGVSAITCGSSHTCALTSAGGVKCWGNNASGQLGDNSLSVRVTPVDVVGLASGVAAISAGISYTCALMSGGGAKCWGDESYGQLGVGNGAECGSSYTCTTPTSVLAVPSGVVSMVTSGAATCFLGADGGVQCWGVAANAFGGSYPGSGYYPLQPVWFF